MNNLINNLKNKNMDERTRQMMQARQDYENLLEQSSPIVCSNCGHNTFAQTFLMRRISAIVSPNGMEALIPSPIYECTSCGQICKDTVHPAILAADKEYAEVMEETINTNEIAEKCCEEIVLTEE